MSILQKSVVSLLAVVVSVQMSVPGIRFSWADPVINSPVSQTVVSISQELSLLKGLVIHPDAPLAFDFLVEPGATPLFAEDQRKEYDKLIRYFFAALAIPESDMWVNLSPYEKDRMIPDAFGRTDMGRDLLAQDYALKQLTASLLNPETESGKKFWDAVYAQVDPGHAGLAQDTVNSFNKIWIVPRQARVYQHPQGAFVLGSDLSVMLEEDYLARKENTGMSARDPMNRVMSDLFKLIVLPEIEQRVNHSPTFANLRQIYHSMILAVWYKRALKQSWLAKSYANHSHVKGLETPDPSVIEDIYHQYLEAFERGAYDTIKEDYDAATNSVVLRKYFSGGALPVADDALLVETGAQDADGILSVADVVRVNLAQLADPVDRASLVQDQTLQGFLDGIKSSQFNSFTDISMEASIEELDDRAEGALGKGGLGFLTGDTWGAYHRLEKFRGCGVMPLYARHYEDKQPVDWDREPGINPVILSDGNPLVLNVSLKERQYNVKVYWVNRNGMPVFLLRSDEIFQTLYPDDDRQRLPQYALLAKAYVDLMYRLGISPKVMRLSESQLLFVQTAMENDRNVNPDSLFKETKTVFTTHTPESAGIPFFRDYQIDILRDKVDGYLFEELVVGGEINTAEALAYRATAINGVSREHGIVSMVAVLKNYVSKITAIQNGSAGDTWRSKVLNDLLKQRKNQLENIRPQELFDIKKRIKEEDLQQFLRQKFGVQFSDPQRPLIGFVRRLVAYKEQRMIIPYIRWIVGDTDKEYYHPDTGERLGYGLGANLLIGGHALDGTTLEWKRQFEALAQDPDIKGKLVFVPYTGITFRKLATIASDLWISMPRPTREASGTSDSAAALNGTINIATATGGPLAYIRHQVNGWLMDVFKGMKLSQVIDGFDRGDAWFIDTFYKDGGRQLAGYLKEAVGIYNNDHPRWLDMMQQSFLDGHKYVSIETMIEEYGKFFENVLTYGENFSASYELDFKQRTGQPMLSEVDRAQFTDDPVGKSPVGGIDLDSKNMDFQVDDAQGRVILPEFPGFDVTRAGDYQPVIVDVRSGVAVSSLVDLGRPIR